MVKSGKKGKRGLIPVAFALDSALSSVEKANIFNLMKVENNWIDIVGQRLANVSKPLSLAYRELEIGVPEPVWVDTLLYLKKEITQKANKVVGKDIIDSIRIVRRWSSAKSEQEVEITQLPPDTIEYADKIAEDIDDPELRELAKRVMLKSATAEQTRYKRG